MRDRAELFAAFAKSPFRSRFRLGAKEREYLAQKGMATIIDHARDFITQRLAPAEPKNDGRQTSMRGHPAFIAQHATATCCRGCLAKWHRIGAGAELTEKEIEYVVGVIEAWLERE